VFVSSSLQELAAERGVVRGTIEQLRPPPVMFESGAGPHPPQAVYRASSRWSPRPTSASST
jgi:hypothetical protein